MSAPSTYASPEEFERFVGGASRLQKLVNMQPEAVRPHVADLLKAASGRMNEAFQAAGYLTPLDPAAATDATLRAQLESDLRVLCIGLAASYLAAGVSELPEGLASAAADAKARLADIKAKRAGLAGAVRTESAGGSLSIVRFTDGSRLDPRVYEAARKLFS